MTQETVSIRFATEADARQIAEVHDASSQAIYRGLLPNEVLAYFSATRREALWKQVLSEGKTATLVLEREGVQAAFGVGSVYLYVTVVTLIDGTFLKVEYRLENVEC